MLAGGVFLDNLPQALLSKSSQHILTLANGHQSSHQNHLNDAHPVLLCFPWGWRTNLTMLEHWLGLFSV